MTGKERKEKKGNLFTYFKRDIIFLLHVFRHFILRGANAGATAKHRLRMKH